MHRTNVDGTESIFKVGQEAGVDRIVYVSTINYFGNTFGQVLKEGDERPSMDFVSCYDETKYRAHEIALDFIERGAPIVITQPGSVYGPKDHSQVGRMISDAQRGRAKLLMFPDLGINMVHVEDVAAGIVLALDKGKVGESYILGGHIGTMGELVRRVAELSGHKPPRLTLPASLIRASLPLAPVITRVMGLPTQPTRDGERERRGHLLGDRRQGPSRARLLPARFRRRTAPDLDLAESEAQVLLEEHLKELTLSHLVQAKARSNS